MYRWTSTQLRYRNCIVGRECHSTKIPISTGPEISITSIGWTWNVLSVQSDHFTNSVVKIWNINMNNIVIFAVSISMVIELIDRLLSPFGVLVSFVPDLKGLCAYIEQLHGTKCIFNCSIGNMRSHGIHMAYLPSTPWHYTLQIIPRVGQSLTHWLSQWASAPVATNMLSDWFSHSLTNSAHKVNLFLYIGILLSV